MPFTALGLHPSLVRATRDLGYKEPTPVQAGAIPPGLSGRDVIGTAQTGTGKTAAFLLPLLHRLLGQPRGSIKAVIVSPTRELAEQIDDVCRGLARHTPVKSTLIVGGRPMGPQEHALRSGVDIVVATPGRLLDHIQRGTARLDRVTTLVLDEADSMLDMGFLPDVKRIIARLPARNHTLLFSATMPPVIATLAKEILKNPATVQIGRRTAAAVGITQAAYPVPQHLKTSLLRHLLRETEMPSVLVFTRTKHLAKKIARAWRPTASRSRNCTATERRPSGRRRWTASAAASFRSWWPRTSPLAGWMWITSRTSSAPMCRTCRKTTFTGSGAPAARVRRVMRSFWCRGRRKARCPGSSDRSGCDCRG